VWLLISRAHSRRDFLAGVIGAVALNRPPGSALGFGASSTNRESGMGGWRRPGIRGEEAMKERSNEIRKRQEGTPRKAAATRG
jgi:hypothetical protein